LAELSLKLKIFIASPNDVVPEREVAKEEVAALAQECARQRLLLMSYLWERDGRPSADKPQTYLNEELRSAELTIVILWSRLGLGTGEEFVRAGQQVRSGASDEVLLYFKTAPPPAGAADADVDKVRQFKAEVSNFAFDFETADDFRARLRHDLRLWVERWYDVPEICQFALHNSTPVNMPAAYLGENRYARLRAQFAPEREPELAEVFGRAAVEAYQSSGPEAYALPIAQQFTGGAKERAAYVRPKGASEPVPSAPFLEDRRRLYFGDPEWFFFFCAIGLVDAVRKGQVEAVERRPYTNPVHQLFKVLAQKYRDEIVSTLRNWLLNTNNVTFARPIVRNFSAYVIGMLGAIEAQDDLAQAIREDEGEDVKLYCITSLGKLRARRQLPVLVEVYGRTADLSIRLTVSQAVCRMVGIAHYEL
jgi:hypothetical protein